MKAFVMQMLTKETRRHKTFGKHSIRLMVAKARALFNDAIRDGIVVSNLRPDSASFIGRHASNGRRFNRSLWMKCTESNALRHGNPYKCTLL